MVDEHANVLVPSPRPSREPSSLGGRVRVQANGPCPVGRGHSRTVRGRLPTACRGLANCEAHHASRADSPCRAVPTRASRGCDTGLHRTCRAVEGTALASRKPRGLHTNRRVAGLFVVAEYLCRHPFL